MAPPRARHLVLVLTTLVVALAACSARPSGPTAPPGPPRVTTVPADGAAEVNPGAPARVDVAGGVLGAITLTRDDGVPVAGRVAPDGRSWASTGPLAYGRGYTWTGTASGLGGRTSPVAGGFRTLVPARTVAARFTHADDTELGVAAPVELAFSGRVRDRAAVERALRITTSLPQEGAWAWLPDTAEGSRVHYRPREYWRPGQVIDVRADLVGVDLGGGALGAADVSNHLRIGRSSITRADVVARRLTVVRDGRTVLDAPASFGTADDPNLITRDGTHVVMSKAPEQWLSNPAYGYSDVYVRWAARIDNNGEFVHSNPATVNAVGQQNVTHGCINMDEADARAFYEGAMVGDPVEVVGSPVPLSAADGDLYDWTIPWDRWRSMSALDGVPPPAVAPIEVFARLVPSVRPGTVPGVPSAGRRD